jgi:hypothetical protein
MTHPTAGHVLAEIAVEPVVVGSGHGESTRPLKHATGRNSQFKSVLYLRRWKGGSMTFFTPSPDSQRGCGGSRPCRHNRSH